MRTAAPCVPLLIRISAEDALLCAAKFHQLFCAHISMPCQRVLSVLTSAHHLAFDACVLLLPVFRCSFVSALRTLSSVQPNFINYSALISACSASGRWQEAEKTFSDMLAALESDKECCPNTITFSSLITACERGGRVDRALHWYHQMEERAVEADHIIYRCVEGPCLSSSPRTFGLRSLNPSSRCLLRCVADPTFKWGTCNFSASLQ